MDRLKRYEMIERDGAKARGRKELLKYLNGEKLSPTQTILAKCYECCNYFRDGRLDCGVDACPNYAYMPYNPNRPKRTRNLTAEQRAEVRERFKKATAR